jgi:hypothetical protein
LTARAAGEPIAVRQERAFTRDFADRSGQLVVLEEPRHDLFRGQALGDRELVLDHLAFDQRFGDVAGARALVELVFAEFQIRAARLHRHRSGDEDPRIADHAFALEQLADIANAKTARNVDDLVLGQRARLFETLVGPIGGESDDDGEQQHDREDRIADDHDGMTGTP